VFIMNKVIGNKIMVKTTFVFLMAFMMLGIFASGVFAATADLSDSQVLSITLLNQNPDPAAPGDVFEIRVGIENLGGKSVADLVLEVIPEYPFSLPDGESATQEMGTISAYQTGDNMKIVKFNIKADTAVKAGSYDLKLSYKSKYDTSSIQTTVSIQLQSSASAEVIHIDKTILIPGQETPLKFIINNLGTSPLRDLTFTWVSPDKAVLPVGSDNRRYIAYINAGESAELEYIVIADTSATPGLYELDLSLVYSESATGTTSSIETLAGIYVGGETDFDISFSESSSGQTSLSVANIGSTPAYSVSVLIPKQTGWAASGSNSVIVGNLNSGDYTVATFTLTQKQPSQNLLVDLVYTDTQGKRHTVEKTVGMQGSDGSMMMDGNNATGNGASSASPSENFQRYGGQRSMIPGMGGRSSSTNTVQTAVRNVIIVLVVVAVIVAGILVYRKKRYGYIFRKNKK
jgi:hypothetical protein